jgi:hypothetical protein
MSSSVPSCHFAPCAKPAIVLGEARQPARAGDHSNPKRKDQRITLPIPHITRVAATAFAPIALAALALAALAPGTPNTSSAPTTAASHAAYKMKQVQVIDKAGFGKPVPAATLLIPPDWKFESSVQWGNRGCFPDLTAGSFKAESPDGKIVFEAFPSFTWQFANNPSVQKYLVMENRQGQQVGLKPCPVNSPLPAADVLKENSPSQISPGQRARRLRAHPRRAAVHQLPRAGPQQKASSGGPQVQFRADSSRARFKYDVDGKPVEEWVTTVSVAEASSISTGNGGTQGINCRAVMLYTFRTPQGQLDANEKLFRMIRTSLQWEPEWQKQYLANANKLTEFQQKQRQMRAQMIRQFQQYEVEVINGVVANRERGMNQTVVGADQLIRGVEPYRDPAIGKTSELSNLYGHAWTNGTTSSSSAKIPTSTRNPSSTATGIPSNTSSPNRSHALQETLLHLQTMGEVLHMSRCINLALSTI